MFSIETANLKLLEMTTEQQIWKVVDPYLAAEKLELDDLELVGQGRGRTLRVVVDGQGGLDLDRISEVSRGLSRLLDSLPDLEGPYQLEVSSPGLERRLNRPSHFIKSVGREVIVKTSTGTTRGTLTAADGAGFSVKAEAADGETVTFPYDQVLSARTVFRWERSPKPGQPRSKS